MDWIFMVLGIVGAVGILYFICNVDELDEEYEIRKALEEERNRNRE